MERTDDREHNEPSLLLEQKRIPSVGRSMNCAPPLKEITGWQALLCFVLMVDKLLVLRQVDNILDDS